jgi:hypothetical protein
VGLRLRELPGGDGVGKEGTPRHLAPPPFSPLTTSNRYWYPRTIPAVVAVIKFNDITPAVVAVIKPLVQPQL